MRLKRILLSAAILIGFVFIVLFLVEKVAAWAFFGGAQADQIERRKVYYPNLFKETTPQEDLEAYEAAYRGIKEANRQREEEHIRIVTGECEQLQRELAVIFEQGRKEMDECCEKVLRDSLKTEGK